MMGSWDYRSVEWNTRHSIRTHTMTPREVPVLGNTAQQIISHLLRWRRQRQKRIIKYQRTFHFSGRVWLILIDWVPHCCILNSLVHSELIAFMTARSIFNRSSLKTAWMHEWKSNSIHRSRITAECYTELCWQKS